MKKTVLLVTVLSITFFSCTTAYFPTEINAPAFHAKNEFHGSITYGNSGTNLLTAYSFMDNFAAIGGISYLRTFGSRKDFQRNWEFGLGYFNKLHKDKSVYGELFAGFDITETRSQYDAHGEFSGTDGFENAKYYRLFIQPDISFPFRNVDLIFAMKFSYFNFSSYQLNSPEHGTPPKALGVEPAFTIRLGMEHFKLRAQTGFCLIGVLSGSEFNYDKVFVNFGVAFSF